MIIFIFRRLSLLVITLFLLTLVGFSLNYFIPQAPFYGTDLLNAYRFYFSGLLRWDLGVSNINGEAITQQLRKTLPVTIELCVLAFIFALLIGISLGVVAGAMHGKWADSIIGTLALFGFSIPVFLLALVLMLFFSLHLGWLPVSGRVDLLYQVEPVTGSILIDTWLSDSPYRHEMVRSALHHMILPVTTLAIVPATEVINLMRISASHVFSQSYIKAATIRGLSCWTIIRRHVLHNALPPIVHKLGLQFSTMLTLTMITEVVFNWPGLGQWLINALYQQDYAAISAGVMVIGMLVIVVNVLSDILSVVSYPLKHQRKWYAA